MPANFVRATLAIEIALYAMLGAWLHDARGWSAAGLAAGAVGFALAIRLALVTLTSFIAWFT